MSEINDPTFFPSEQERRRAESTRARRGEGKNYVRAQKGKVREELKKGVAEFSFPAFWSALRKLSSKEDPPLNMSDIVEELAPNRDKEAVLLPNCVITWREVETHLINKTPHFTEDPDLRSGAFNLPVHVLSDAPAQGSPVVPDAPPQDQSTGRKRSLDECNLPDFLQQLTTKVTTEVQAREERIKALQETSAAKDRLLQLGEDERQRCQVCRG